jgi:molecular chaperone GrpE
LETNNTEMDKNQEKVANGESEDLPKALAEEKAKSEANLAGWQRTQADFVNYKRHAEEDKVEITRTANASLILDILPVLDDYARAMTSVPADLAELEWVKGIKMIDRKLRDILEKRGISVIQAQGQEFDPRFHEAVTYGKGKRYMVIQQVEAGYKLQDKVIRPAKVIVGNGEA